MEQISIGTASCGHYGQVFRTNKCAHCYIAALEEANSRIGRWLSAALDDEMVCPEMKADIRKWMEGAA